MDFSHTVFPGWSIYLFVNIVERCYVRELHISNHLLLLIGYIEVFVCMCFSVVAQDQGHSPLPVKKSDAATALHRHHHHRRDQEAVLHDQTAVQDLVQEAQALDRDPNRTPSHVQDQGLPDDQGKRAKGLIPDQDLAPIEG